MRTGARPVVIREMIEADIDALASSLGWPRAGIENRYREQLQGQRETFVAEVAGTPVGSVSLNEHEAVPGLLHLFALDVAAPFQRQGTGTSLIAKVECEATERGLHGVWLDVETDNADARRLYERLDYRWEGEVVVARYTAYPSGEPVEETCYRMLKRFGGLRSKPGA